MPVKCGGMQGFAGSIAGAVAGKIFSLVQRAAWSSVSIEMIEADSLKTGAASRDVGPDGGISL